MTLTTTTATTSPVETTKTMTTSPTTATQTPTAPVHEHRFTTCIAKDWFKKYPPDHIAHKRTIGGTAYDDSVAYQTWMCECGITTIIIAYDRRAEVNA